MILKKLGDEYKLYGEDNSCIATTQESPHKRLSKQNCDEIFGVVDVNDIRKSVNTSVYLGGTTSNTLMSIATEQSLQQPTEIDVDIEMWFHGTRHEKGKWIERLDENGCLILSKKKNE